MYEQFYGFREKPFQIVPNPEYLYRSLKHDKALTYLEYGLSESLGFILLTGEIGSGKTTLIQYILNQLDESMVVGVIFNTNVSNDQLLGMILNEFELPPRDDKADKLDALNHFLVGLYTENRKALLIIDEGQNLSAEALEEVRMLSNLQSDDQTLLQIMLVGQPELKKKLQGPSMRQFAQRIAVNYHLTGLSLQETGEYMAHRLQKAGGSPELFTPAAVKLIFKLSGGIPRSINIACQAALVYGFADEKPRITQDIVRQLIRDDIGISLDVAVKEPELDEKPADAPASPPSNGFHRYLKNLENEIKDLKNLVSVRVDELETSAKNSQNELVERLGDMLKYERKRNQSFLRRLHTLELKYLASRKVRKKLEAAIVQLQNNGKDE